MSDSLISCKSIACGLLLAGLSLTSATVPAYAEDWNKNCQIVESGFVKVGGTEKNRMTIYFLDMQKILVLNASNLKVLMNTMRPNVIMLLAYWLQADPEQLLSAAAQMQ